MFSSDGAQLKMYNIHNLNIICSCFMFAVENSTPVFLFVILNGPLTHPQQTSLDYLNSIPPTAGSKLRQFRSPHTCLCHSVETLKTDGPFYLVSMPGKVKDPTQGVNV